MRTNQYCLLVLLAFLVPTVVIGITYDLKNACVQQQGHGLVFTEYRTYNSDKFWNSQGKIRPAYNDFDKYEYSFYLEYGLTPRNTISAKSKWAKIKESINGRTFGFEDTEIGWKHYIGKKWDYLISTELVGIIPIKGEYRPGLRYGRWGGEINLLGSKGFCLWDRYGSYDLRLGYRLYQGFPSDQVRADAGVHFCPISHLRLTASAHLEYGVFNGRSRINQSLFLYNPNYRLLRGQMEAMYCVYKCASVCVGYYRHLWGQNVGTNGGTYGGLQIQF